MSSIQASASNLQSGGFEQAIASADSRLFDAIPAELTLNDRTSLLRLQSALRATVGDYVYLEIGSHLGGSIQPHLLDPKCRKIISVDPRPLVQPDQRGVRYGYPQNSTAAMLALLRSLAPTQVSKLDTIDRATPDIGADQIEVVPHLLFIDGEHTDDATYDDYVFCKRVCCANGIIVFHDASVIYNALASIIDGLGESKLSFRAYHLPDTVFVVELGSLSLLEDACVAALALNNHVGYLTALRLNDGYRRFANLWPFRMIRHGAAKIGFRGWADRHGYGLPTPYRR